MACTGRILVWWDRDVDSSGRPIRSDVRLAAQEIWQQAYQQTMAAVGDYGPAAELMENTVAQVSRYLDRKGVPLSSRKHGLVMVAFCRALRRYARKFSRLEAVGGACELARCASLTNWAVQADARLEFEKLVEKLSPRNAEILMLRAAGFEWKEIAAFLDDSVPTLRNRFWREIYRLL